LRPMTILERLRHPFPHPQTVCFACGASNANGLKLQFRVDDDGSAIADWTPSDIWEGYRGIIHGGIVSTVLDEAMSKAVAAATQPALTCHLEVRLRRAVAPGESLVMRGGLSESVSATFGWKRNSATG